MRASVVLFACMPIIDGPRPGARQPRCLSSLKQLALATLMYAQDYDDRLPLRRNWSDGIYPYLKNRSVYVCPSPSDGGSAPNAWQPSVRGGGVPSAPPGYAFNSRLAGLPVAKIARQAATPMEYDSWALRWNASDPVWSFARRHDGEGNVAFLDGHVRRVRDAGTANPMYLGAAAASGEGAR